MRERLFGFAATYTIPGSEYQVFFSQYLLTVLHADHLVHISLDREPVISGICYILPDSTYVHLQRSPCRFCSRDICKPVLIMQENMAGQGLALRFASSWYVFFSVPVTDSSERHS